ncbi:MAG: DUF4350 domain-containing protein [Phaeodactylibacter sp.]|nr:DUF4350 domain-containing protein [Phaeodactylibacter sp.]MCB9296972.1 DUF4350 domain-containing protein [Lewinellaceae bacterium]
MAKFTLLYLFLFTATLHAQQIPDTSRFFGIETPRFPAGKGPAVMIDAAHNNFHTLDGRYRAFGNILEADGYRLLSNEEPFTEEGLGRCDILVISNPLHASNQGNWQLPTPSAFTPEEIAAVRQWVAGGGRLFLIADHMPFAGAAADLGRAFGFEFLNSFAMDNRQRQVEYFTHAHGLLHGNPITYNLDSIVTFTGSAFLIPTAARPLISLDGNYTILMPEQAWNFTDDTPFVSGSGFHQLACRAYGKGKVMVSGEAAMFSAQLAGPNQAPMGLNNPAARNNILLLRNLVGWLAEK